MSERVAAEAGEAQFWKESEHEGLQDYPAIHGGRGGITAKYIFKDNLALNPLVVLLYKIPPGASEGAHAHQEGDAEGAADELYYIVSGDGEMDINGRRVSVTTGDNVFVPRGVMHGIENTSTTADLKVYLLVLVREPAYFANLSARGPA
jgi:oxalate decarboxylase/phosphoglucose isomerase-like protein (cupin superfamily)